MLFIIVFVSIVVIYAYSAELKQGFLSRVVLDVYVSDFLLSPKVLMSILYWAAACLMGIFILQVSDKFGQGILLNFLLGRYHKPKEESRIFMFMDLKSSTTIAEKLGNLKFGSFLKDYYSDITDAIRYSKAEVYQYVGDEIVLSWPVGKKTDMCKVAGTVFHMKKKNRFFQISI